MSIILFYPLLNTGSLFLASLISAINSFFLVPLVPIMLELACEMAFPVGEGSAAGMLFANGNFSGFLLDSSSVSSSRARKSLRPSEVLLSVWGCSFSESFWC